MKKFLILTIVQWAILANAQFKSPLYSAPNADEFQVEFSFIFKTEIDDLAAFRQFDQRRKIEYVNENVLPTLKYLYGPLSNRYMGNPQRDFKVDAKWSQAYFLDGHVVLPYTYKARWIISRALSLSKKILISVPFTAGNLETPQWTKCTDSDVSHQNMQLYWYYWDPARPGCDQVEGIHYQNILVELKQKTQNQKSTFPEYENLIRNSSTGKVMSLTFAFGYTQEVQNPEPERDNDYGMLQYRDFLNYVRKNAGSVLKETPIFQSEFPEIANPQKIMGHRFIGFNSGVTYKIDVLAAGDVDQMDIFSKSFAHDQDSFFGWFGHSRLGWGFDSDILDYNIKRQPQYYSITRAYQIVYWAGCNSYSYYTLPFFQLKADVQLDPFGTKSLDIISNGLSSYFALNSANAKIILKHMLNWEKRASYQVILGELESAAHRIGADNIMINVLGDEDNRP